MSNVEMNNIDVECKRCRVNKYCGTLITCEQTKEVYQQARADAERDFQNSDYWNDYLAKVIVDERAKINDELSEVQQILILYDVDTAEKRREIIDLLEQIKTSK